MYDFLVNDLYIYIFQIIKYKHDSHNTPELGTER